SLHSSPTRRSSDLQQPLQLLQQPERHHETRHRRRREQERAQQPRGRIQLARGIGPVCWSLIVLGSHTVKLPRRERVPSHHMVATSITKRYRTSLATTRS